MIPKPNMKKYTQESIDYIKSAFETLDFEDHQLDDDGLPISTEPDIHMSRLDEKGMERVLDYMSESNNENLKFAKAAHNLWVRFKSYDKHPPYCLWYGDNPLAVCMITTLEREPYANLYEIFTIEKGYAGHLYWMIMKNLYGTVTRLKMSCTPSSIGWHMKNGIIGWGTDPSGSIRVDIPIKPTREEQLELRDNWKDNLDYILPPGKNRVRLRDEENSFGPKKQPKVDEAIDKVGEFYLRKYL